MTSGAEPKPSAEQALSPPKRRGHQEQSDWRPGSNKPYVWVKAPAVNHGPNVAEQLRLYDRPRSIQRLI